MNNRRKGERAILSDGTKVVCFKEIGNLLTCMKPKNDNWESREDLELIGTLPTEHWKWRCPPESLQK